MDYSWGVRQYLVKHFSHEPGWLISPESDPSAYHSELLRSAVLGLFTAVLGLFC